MDLSTSCGLRRSGSTGLEPATRHHSNHRAPRSPTSHAPTDQGQGSEATMIQLGGTRTCNTIMMTTTTTTAPRRQPGDNQDDQPTNLAFLYIFFFPMVRQSPSEAASTLIGRRVVRTSPSEAASTLIGRRVVRTSPSEAASTLIGQRIMGRPNSGLIGQGPCLPGRSLDLS